MMDVERAEDAGVVFMEECNVDCNLCGASLSGLAGRALHVCFSEDGLDSACMNICRDCFGLMVKAVPDDWLP
jgi:hypothetical protein